MYDKREVQRILKENGWTFQRMNGSHATYTNNKNEHLTLAPNKCNRMIMRRLIKEYNLKVN